MSTDFANATTGTSAVTLGSHANPDSVQPRSPSAAANDPLYNPAIPSLKTQQAYLRDTQRLLDGRAVIGARRTSYRYRAAWVWFLQQALNGEVAPPLRAKLLAALERCPPGSDRFAENRGRKSAYQDQHIKSQSKRPGLRSLPNDWREQLIGGVDDAHLFISLSLLSLTGLRPSELERGVTVLWKDSLLAVGISGSKLGSDRGQPWRILSLDGHHPWVVGLIDALELEEGAAIGFRYPKAKVQRQIRGLAESCFPTVSTAHLPSPLSFRHQFSSDLKRAGVSRHVIAAALGHASERTSEIYGRKSQGRAGGTGLVKASAQREIRLARGCSHIVSVTSASPSSSQAQSSSRPRAVKKQSPTGPGDF